MTKIIRIGFVSFAAWLAPLGMFAQAPAGPATEAEDVPGRGVARISLINGDVTIRRGDSGDTIAAAVNAPLVASDRVLTGLVSRTELQLDGANRVRIAAESDLRLAEIEYRRYTVELGRGTLTWHVARNSAADIDINTPSVSVRPTEPGDYRITVNADGTTEVTARTGAAEIYSPRGVERVRRGRTTLVRGDRTDPEFQTIAELREDEWDRFNLSRDRELDRSQSRQYLADDIVGAEELDQHGTWIDSAPYGRVWRPRVAAGWSPYSQGRWVWLDFYGWSWVSYDQFGWAPFHYGSWFYQNAGWCWYPGPRHVRTWWRPAMVAWFGFGGGRGGFGVGVGFGNFGWVPLAPFERFRPWYGRGFYGNQRTNIYNNIRIVNNYNIVNNYQNARVDGGARAVDAGQFGRSGGRFDRVGEANLRNAGLMQGQLPVSPGRESLAFNDSRVSDGTRGAYEGSFHSRRPAVAQERIPFAEQQRGIEQGARAFGGDLAVRGGDPALRGSDPAMRGSDPALRGGAGNGGRGLDSAVRGGGRGAEAVAVDGASRAGDGTRGENGWRRVGDRVNSSGRSEGARSGGDSPVRGGDSVGSRSASDSGGWRRFGEPGTRGGASAASENGDGSAGAARGSFRNGTVPNYGAARESVSGSGRELEPAVRGGSSPASGSGGNGWRRFGTPSSGSAADSPADAVRGGREYGRGDNPQPERGYSERSGSRDSYSYGDSVRGAPGRQSDRQSPATDPYSGSRRSVEGGDSGFGGYRDRSSNRSESIRVNPPVLRDRSDAAPRERRDAGGYSGGGYRGGSRMEGTPSNGGEYRSVPAYGGRAPSNDGGGSFGGMRGGGRGAGGGDAGSGMRGGGGSSPSDGNYGGSRGSDGGGSRGGGGRRGNQ